MFAKKDIVSPPRTPQPREATSIVAGCTLEGKFTFKGTTLIGCTIKGDVDCDSLLIVEAGAVIDGRVSAREILVRGDLHGDILANTSIEAWPGAVITGAVIAPSLRVDEGAKVNADLLIAKERPVTHINRLPATVTALPVTVKPEPAPQPRAMFVKAAG
jgi:cytoskeletal protein CcmA (bactofilin family)